MSEINNPQPQKQAKKGPPAMASTKQPKPVSNDEAKETLKKLQEKSEDAGCPFC